jgi:transcriptional regulator with XRE-family HTH domain
MPIKSVGEKLKELREKHFPGESLRKVSERLEESGLGKNFFTYLSKIESGTMLPSENLLKQLSDAYSLSRDEFMELLAHHTTEKLNARLRKSNLINKNQEIPAESVVELFRKIKKK